MATIDRYKKSGGFSQLLLLLETCGPAKQQKLMELVQSESPVWYEALKEKLLSIEKILSWSDQAVLEVFSQQYDLTIGIFFHGQKPEVKARIMKLMPNSRKIKIEDEFTSKQPTPPEIATINFKIIESTRSMISKRELNMATIDPKLDIPDGIEDKLANMAKSQPDVRHTATVHADTTSNGTTQAAQAVEKIEKIVPNSTEVVELQRKVLELHKENTNLKQELRIAHSKLEQIKKIA